MHFVFAHRRHAQRRDAMKQLFTRLEVIDVRRRRADHALIDMRRIVHQAAEPGMCLKLGAVRQINGLGRNVVDRRLTVVAQRRQILSLAEQPIPRRQRRQREAHRHQIGELLEHGAVIRRSRRRIVLPDD